MACAKFASPLKRAPNDWYQVEKILETLIRMSIAHVRSQLEGRKAGTMTFDEAMDLIAQEQVMVTRPSWGIFNALRMDEEYTDEGTWIKTLGYWRLDNTEGTYSGDGHPYHPTEEDRAAKDWMLYQTPEEHWVELEFD